MPLTTFKSVRGRLLALLALIAIPLTLVSSILAITTYREVTGALVRAERQTASSFAVRARLWFRGMLRVSVTAVTGAEAAAVDNAGCEATVRRIFGEFEGLVGLRIRTSAGISCAAVGPGFDADDIGRVAMAQRKQAMIIPWRGQSIGRARYGVARLKNDSGAEGLFVVIDVMSADAARAWEATLILDRSLLDQAFEIGLLDAGSQVAVVTRQRDILVSRGIEQSETDWLPQEINFGQETYEWAVDGQAETRHNFALQQIAAPDLFIIARFDSNTRTAAFRQFLILLVTPLMIILLLAMTYSVCIRRDIGRWINGIEAAARRNVEQSGEVNLAPVGDDMPSDIRSVAEAYNAMVTASTKREVALSSALNDNRNLMRDLHHHIKNSLQVVQSYLALSRRADREARHAPLLLQAEAKVQVLAMAYRVCLTDQGFKPATIGVFLGELKKMAEAMTGGEAFRSNVDDMTASAKLPVERLIPLGLTIIESARVGIDKWEAALPVVSMAMVDGGEIELIVAFDNGVPAKRPDKMLLSGLSRQLQVREQSLAGSEIVHWRFSAAQ
jgi:two-component system, sensor histidine kinase PdtaS